MHFRNYFILFLVALCMCFISIGNAEAVFNEINCAGTTNCKIQYSTIGTCSTITDVLTKTEAQVSANDSSYSYPYGLIQFDLSDCPSVEKMKIKSSGPATGAMKLIFMHDDDTRIDLTGFIYRRYGPTPDNPSPHWYDFMWDGTTGAVIDGPNGTVTLYFIEGERGDDDLGNPTDGKIVDQGGPARGGQAIPTMTEWGMLIFVVLAGLGAVYYLRRRKTAKN